MKKVLSLFIAAIAICNLFVFVASACAVSDNEVMSTDGLWQYEITDKGAEITTYLGNSTKITVPETLDGNTVESIGTAAFFDSKIKEITLPDTVQEIGWWAFYGCENLEHIELGSKVNTIEFGAFMNCPELDAITLSSTICKIGEDAFAVSCKISLNVYDKYSKEKVSKQKYSVNNNFKIIGFEGTIAEKYAYDNNLVFQSTGSVMFGDANCDGKIDSNDIDIIESYLKGNISLSDSQMRNCDVNADGRITEEDYLLVESCVENTMSYYSFPAAANLAESQNYLEGKTMYCDGDSVAKGTGTNIFGNDYYSYCNYVADKYGMTMTNCAVPGTTIAKQKEKTSENNKSILERVREMKGDYDVIMLDGGFNDLFQNISIGSITADEDKSGIYDEYTTAGALESICYFLNENYHDSIKLFVLCHNRNANPDQYKYWDTIKRVLDKWEIEYIDLSTKTDLSDINQTISNQYFKYRESSNKGDGVHPLAYTNRKIYGPYVAEKLNSLAQESFSLHFENKSVEIGMLEKYNAQPVSVYGFDDYELKWSSDDKSVADVDSNGLVTPKGLGTTVIRVCTVDGITAEYSVSVKFMAVDLTLNKRSVVVSEGEMFTIEGYVMSGTAAYYKEFTSSDSAVVQVSTYKGTVTAVGKGKAVITCKTCSGVKAECEVTVK